MAFHLNPQWPFNIR